MKYTIAYLRRAHRHADRNEKELNAASTCACFHCMKTFDSSEITNWIKDNEQRTALCPHCGVDAVLSDGHPIQFPDFLQSMHDYWF